MIQRWVRALLGLITRKNYQEPCAICYGHGCPDCVKDYYSYKGMWIAVKDSQVLASARELRVLLAQVRKMGARSRGVKAHFVKEPSRGLHEWL